MRNRRISIAALFISFIIFTQVPLIAQEISFKKSGGLSLDGLKIEGRPAQSIHKIPLFSFDINGKTYASDRGAISFLNQEIIFSFPNGIKGYVKIDKDFDKAWKASIRFENNTWDTLVLENVVPFGKSDDHVYITGEGPWSLALAYLYRPGKEPVGVILPDNAWEMGYASIPLRDGRSLCAIARRTAWEDAYRHRYKTYLYPHSWVEYTLYIDNFEGEWQNGLKRMFQEHFLFDLESFDNSLFERQDLQWIRHDYLMILQFAWDHQFYDWKENKYNFKNFLQEAEDQLGGFDVFGIWPTWPALGMDQRNQWDLYADLPGGLPKLRELSDYAGEQGTKFFIAYNPWDQSTRSEDHHKGMARLIEATDADGVVLDTRGKSSYELQRAADSVKAGVVMYSEGMAVTRDMPGIISGRVHNAIVMPPPLNMNKLIKPDFAIFRVLQPSQGSIHREVSISLFNGYGNEINNFGPGRPEIMKEDYVYLGRITRILRENSRAFNSFDWEPLIPTLADSIWVNRWRTEQKTIFTIYSLIPEGFDEALFEAEDEFHYVSLYHHEEILPDTISGQAFVKAKTHAFDKSWLNTKKEGNVDCIASFRQLLDIELIFDTLHVQSGTGNEIRIWAGNPAYDMEPVLLKTGKHQLNLYDHFGRYEGKFVVQLFDGSEIIDERVIYVEPGTARLVSKFERTRPVHKAPEGMILIEGSEYEYSVKSKPEFIPYPDYNKGRNVSVNSFFMDQYPVTNAQYFEFVKKSAYLPEDTTNYLKHWKDGKYHEHLADYPVVNIGLQDAQAYAEWAGKRLPTEIEWQYAAQGGNPEQKWPWGIQFDSTKCNNALGYITAVDSFPQGASTAGIIDMVGNVWQMTQDVYDNGSYYFNILKGGSYYKPTSSWWYVQGGPKPVNESQMLLLVSPSFNRNATVGFRCVKDIK